MRYPSPTKASTKATACGHGFTGNFGPEAHAIIELSQRGAPEPAARAETPRAGGNSTYFLERGPLGAARRRSARSDTRSRTRRSRRCSCSSRNRSKPTTRFVSFPEGSTQESSVAFGRMYRAGAAEKYWDKSQRVLGQR